MKKTCQNGFQNLLGFIMPMAIGLLVVFLLAFLSGCQSPVSPVNRPPITCLEHIKTNADLVNCLVEYDEKY